MTEREDLFDPAKPYARFYADASGQIAQVHTRRIDGLGFGRAGWRITASCTDETGATLTDGDELQILRAPDGELFTHQVTVQADAAVDIPALLEDARQMMAQKACLAFEVWQAASEIA